MSSAFAAVLAPHDEYDEAEIRKALGKLEQDPEQPLACVYCGKAAETWDHVVALVHRAQPAGSGHRIRNLVPCCSTCNTKKGKKDWCDYLKSLPITSATFKKRKRQISAYIKGCKKDDERAWRNLPEYKRLLATRDKILKLMEEGDKLAEAIRKKLQPAAAKKRR